MKETQQINDINIELKMKNWNWCSLLLYVKKKFGWVGQLNANGWILFNHYWKETKRQSVFQAEVMCKFTLQMGVLSVDC